MTLSALPLTIQPHLKLEVDVSILSWDLKLLVGVVNQKHGDLSWLRRLHTVHVSDWSNTYLATFPAQSIPQRIKSLWFPLIPWVMHLSSWNGLLLKLVRRFDPPTNFLIMELFGIGRHVSEDAGYPTRTDRRNKNEQPGNAEFPFPT
jgi:hypothetical protein